jgi:hypothetical protein
LFYKISQKHSRTRVSNKQFAAVVIAIALNIYYLFESLLTDISLNTVEPSVQTITLPISNSPFISGVIL